jgi:hypothetical protein
MRPQPGVWNRRPGKNAIEITCQRRRNLIRFFERSADYRTIRNQGKRLIDALAVVNDQLAWDRRQTTAYQVETLKKLLVHAYETVPLY